MTKQEREEAMNALHAAAWGTIIEANAENLPALFDGAHAVVITSREAREALGMRHPEGIEDVEALLMPRANALVLTEAIDPKAAIELARVNPADTDLVPMVSFTVQGDKIVASPDIGRKGYKRPEDTPPATPPVPAPEKAPDAK